MMLDPVAIARQFLFVRESGGQNCGLWVGLFQRYTGNGPGDSWCASFVSYVLGVAFQGQSPVVRTASCEEIHQQAIKNDWLVTTPIEGDLFLRLTPEGHAHHVGFVLDGGNGLAGNTSADGVSSNGDRVAEHPLGGGNVVYVQYPRG